MRTTKSRFALSRALLAAVLASACGTGRGLPLGPSEPSARPAAPPAAIALRSPADVSASFEKTAAKREVEFKGKVEVVSTTEIKVSGVTVLVDANTRIEGRGQDALAEITIGETVTVAGTLQANGSVVARGIERSDDRVEFHGKVKSVNSTRVNVEGVEVVVDTRTRVRVDCNGASSVDIQSDQTVRVTGELQADGSVLAVEINVSINVSVEVTCRTERPRGGDDDENDDDENDDDDDDDDGDD